MTIAQALTRLRNAANAIRAALEQKGQTCAPTDGFEDFAAKILAIQTGGSQPQEGNYYLISPSTPIVRTTSTLESAAAVTYKEHYIQATEAEANANVSINTVPIDVTNYNTLTFTATVTSVYKTYQPEFGLYTSTTTGANNSTTPKRTNAYKFSAEECANQTITHTLDISSLSGERYIYYIGCAKIKITELYLGV